MISFRENKSWGITAKHPDVWKFPKVLKEGEKFDRKSTAVKTKTILGYDNHTFKNLLSQKKKKRLDVISWMLTKHMLFYGVYLTKLKASTNCVVLKTNLEKLCIKPEQPGSNLPSPY